MPKPKKKTLSRPPLPPPSLREQLGVPPDVTDAELADLMRPPLNEQPLPEYTFGSQNIGPTAIRVGSGIVGGALQGVGGPLGALGSMAATGLGEDLAQRAEVYEGIRESPDLGRVGVAALTGAVPFPALRGATPLVREAGRAAFNTALPMGMVAAENLAEGRPQSGAELATAGGLGLLMHGGMRTAGAALGALAPRARVQIEGQYPMEQALGPDAGAAVWHGTGATWPPEEGYPIGRPSLEKVRTGTGGMAQGHGFYVAQSPKVGEYYQEVTSRPGWLIGRESVPNRYEDVRDYAIKSGVDSETAHHFAWDVTNNFENPEYAARQALKRSGYQGDPTAHPVTKLTDKMQNEPGEFGLVVEGGQKTIDKMTPDERSAFYDMFGSSYWYRNNPDPIGKLKEQALATVRAQEENLKTTVDSTIRKEQSQWLKEALTKLMVLDKYKPWFHAKPKGNLYTLDLPDEHLDKMLDWDRGLSEQSPYIQEKLAHLDSEINRGQPVQRDVSGAQMYHHLSDQLGGDDKASAYLLSKGIIGNKYLDAQSRPLNETQRRMIGLLEKHKGDPEAALDEAMQGFHGTPREKEQARKSFAEALKQKPSYNLVLFDPSVATPIARNDQPVPLSVLTGKESVLAPVLPPDVRPIGHWEGLGDQYNLRLPDGTEATFTVEPGGDFKKALAEVRKRYAKSGGTS